MSAETGVGPSIASGNQTWRGNWALLPMAPPKTSAAARVNNPTDPKRTAGSILSSASRMTEKSKAPNSASAASTSTTPVAEPTADHTIRIPMKNAKSPTRLVMKAFLAASPAECFFQ